MKTRLLSVTSTKRKKAGVTLLGIMLLLIALTGITTALPSDASLPAESATQPSVGISTDADRDNFDPEIRQLLELLSSYKE